MKSVLQYIIFKSLIFIGLLLGFGLTNGFSIGYNHLNLPDSITGSFEGGTSKIYCTYDFDGKKYRKQSTYQSNYLTTDYVGPYVYETRNSQRRLNELASAGELIDFKTFV